MRTLRQPRYAAFSLLMVFIALVCVGAGTWQIVRFDDKVRANDALTANAHMTASPVGEVLPLVGEPAPGVDAVRYRSVTATGSYDPSHQGLVRLRTVNDVEGYYVLTPLTTSAATLLVVRGFLAARGDGGAPTSVPPPPAGQVSVRGLVQTGEVRHDSSDGIPPGQLWSVDPADQSTRLGAPVYDGYVELPSGQPGTSGLTAIPPPDLSNPAGGAVEPQHFAYIIQWYLFAVLALAAPFAMARAERREQTASRVGDPTDPPPAEDIRAAKLADRYGRPA